MPQGSRGYIGYKKETTWGTDIGGAATRFFPFISETLTPKIPELISAAQRGILDEPKSYQGEKSFGGDLLLEVHPVSIGHIMRSALGAPTGGDLVVTSESVIENCDGVWTYHAGVIGSIDAVDKKKGTHSNKIIVPEGMADTDILAYKNFGKVVGEDISFADGGVGEEDVISQVSATFLDQKFVPGDKIIITGSLAGNNDITTEILSVTAGTINVGTGLLTAEGAGEEITIQSAKNMREVTGFKLWIKSSINTIAGDLELLLNETVGGAFGAPIHLGDIGILVANVWTEVTWTGLDLDSADYDEIKCIGLRLGAELAEFTVRIDDIRMVVAGAATVAREHTFTPMQSLAEEFGGAVDKNTPLWPYTLDIFRDEGLPFGILGAVVNTMNISFSNTDKIVKAACGIIAKNIGVGVAADIALEATKPFVWENAKIGIGGTHAEQPNNDLESFSFTWDNKCVAKYFLNNTAVPGKIIREGGREIPVSFVIDFVNRTEYDLFLLGTERQFQIILEGAVVPLDADSIRYKLQFDFPLVRYLAYPINIGGPGRLTCAVEGKAKYSGGHALQVSLINAETAAEYAG